MHIYHFSPFLPQRIKQCITHILDKGWKAMGQINIRKNINMSTVALFIISKIKMNTNRVRMNYLTIMILHAQ